MHTVTSIIVVVVVLVVVVVAVVLQMYPHVVCGQHEGTWMYPHVVWVYPHVV